jgi:hypothetical protein
MQYLKEKRIANAIPKRKRIANAIPKRKRTNNDLTKTLHRKLKIEQHETL